MRRGLFMYEDEAFVTTMIRHQIQTMNRHGWPLVNGNEQRGKRWPQSRASSQYQPRHPAREGGPRHRCTGGVDNSMTTRVRAKEEEEDVIKVECRRCGKELDVPGALAFGVPDTDGAVW